LQDDQFSCGAIGDQRVAIYRRAMSVASESDPESLLGLARQGDVGALGRLLERYRGYLGLLARLQISRRLQCKVDAADLVQETFLKAARDFGSFRGSTAEEWANWLREILACSTANLVRHYLGTRRRDQRLERELAAELDQSSRALDGGLLAGGSSPSQRAVRREQGLLLADALNQLPDDYREVLDFADTAEVTFDLPPGVTVTSLGGFQSATAVPEPSSIRLLGVVLVLLGAVCWRRRQPSDEFLAV
jgi:RNA polymerase sigma-70 factor (ECF subfamily)